MTTKLIAKDTIQITCTNEEHSTLIHALVSALIDDEEFVKRFGDNESLQLNVKSCIKNIEKEQKLLDEIMFS